MSNTFVTSDVHFGHNNIIKYCNRPFQNSDEMDITIINNWNKIVNPDDEVYILGDFALIKAENDKLKFNRLCFLTNSLNGNKHLLFGNHDYFLDDDYINAGFKDVYHGILEINLSYHYWVMCHYQMVSWNNSSKGAYHLFGHEHWRQQYSPNHQFYKDMLWSERKFNVCMDANNYKPVNINDLVRILDKRPINFNKQ